MERAPTPPCNDIDNDNSPMSNPPFTAVDSQEVPATTTEFLSGTNANRDGTEVPPAATSTAATVPSPLIHDNGHQVISHNSEHPNVSPTSHHEDDNMSAHRKGRWTLDEKVLFLHGLTTYGKGRWKKISIFLPHRSLVQIKSHAQKVLKRQDAGENVYRRLEEHAFRLEGLIKTVFDEQGIRADHMIPQPSPMKKRKGGRGAAAAANSNKKKPASSHNPFYGQDRYAYFSHAVAARSSGFGYPPPPPPPLSHAPYPPSHPYPHGPPPPHAHPSRAYSPHMFETAPPHPFDAPSRAYSPLPPDASYPHAGEAPPMHGSRANSPYPPEVYYSQHAPPPMHGSRANSPYPPPEGYYAPPPQMHASRAYSPHSFEAPVPLVQQAPVPHAPPTKQHATEGVADAGGASTAVAAAALCQLMSCSETTEHAPVPVTARSSDTTGASSSSSSSMGNGSGSLDNGSSSSSAASIPSRQVFFPLDPDPAVVAAVERPRNVVSP